MPSNPSNVIVHELKDLIGTGSPIAMRATTPAEGGEAVAAAEAAPPAEGGAAPPAEGGAEQALTEIHSKKAHRLF